MKKVKNKFWKNHLQITKIRKTFYGREYLFIFLTQKCSFLKLVPKIMNVISLELTFYCETFFILLITITTTIIIPKRFYFFFCMKLINFF